MAAINADRVISSFLTAEIIPFIPAASFTQFILTALAPGVPFLASVSVIEDCDCNNNEAEPINVTIETLTAVSVQEPTTAWSIGLGLAIFAAGRRRAHRGVVPGGLSAARFLSPFRCATAPWSVH
jgi:hypothetical protein